MEFRGEQEAFPSATWERGESGVKAPVTRLLIAVSLQLSTEKTQKLCFTY
jgi:hypothetical protein